MYNIFTSPKLFYKITAAILIIVLLSLCVKWLMFVNTPLISADSQPVSFVYIQGTSVKGLANQLQSKNLLQNTNLFVVLTRLKGCERQLKAGEYRILPGTKPAQLLDQMVHGDMIRHALTILEGWTFAEVKAAVDSNQYLAHDLKGLSDSAIMQKIGKAGEMPEGRFAPDTYFFSGNISDVDILRTAYRLMQKRLDDEWAGRANNAAYKCVYEALIVASIIEKESALKSERPQIAGVVLRRLQIKMPLQMDPTVIYGMGKDYKGKLTPHDLEKDTIYNTYKHVGLPSTPISMPSQDAIHAALHPVESTALYFVAKGDGSHVFASTLKEHDENIRKYLLHNKR
jgi:UPF0755 protein